jgi:hypothetical protein
MTNPIRAALAALLSLALLAPAAAPAQQPDGDDGDYAAEAEAAASIPAAEIPPLSTLRHAVVCPPFKGDPDIAALYRDELLCTLRSSPRVDLLEGDRALARNAPAFTYRISGEVFSEEGQSFVSLQLTDAARRELIASFVSPASRNPAALNQWKRVVRADMQRRVDAIPFECRILRKQGQDSLTLDRGLSSGLRPGMVLQAVVEEEPLISPFTGEEFGRDTPAPVGPVRVFRVNEANAYARPLPDATVPRKGSLYAREF